MLGQLRELAGDPVAPGVHDGGHPVGPPRASAAAQEAQHPSIASAKCGKLSPSQITARHLLENASTPTRT
jgi:hypothetical protein